MTMLKLTTPAPPKEGNFHVPAPFKGLAKTNKRNIPLPTTPCPLQRRGIRGNFVCHLRLFEAFIGGYP